MESYFDTLNIMYYTMNVSLNYFRKHVSQDTIF